MCLVDRGKGVFVVMRSCRLQKQLATVNLRNGKSNCYGLRSVFVRSIPAWTEGTNGKLGESNKQNRLSVRRHRSELFHSYKE